MNHLDWLLKSVQRLIRGPLWKGTKQSYLIHVMPRRLCEMFSKLGPRRA